MNVRTFIQNASQSAINTDGTEVNDPLPHKFLSIVKYIQQQPLLALLLSAYRGPLDFHKHFFAIWSLVCHLRILFQCRITTQKTEVKF